MFGGRDTQGSGSATRAPRVGECEVGCPGGSGSPYGTLGRFLWRQQRDGESVRANPWHRLTSAHRHRRLGAIEKLWSWWFLIGTLITTGPPGAIVGEILIARKAKAVLTKMERFKSGQD